jgi:hypothetical protein
MFVRKYTAMGREAWKKMSPRNSGVNAGRIPGLIDPRIRVIGMRPSWMPKKRMISSAKR